MEHIVQFAINIDDESIRKTVIETAEKQIIDKLYNECKSIIIQKSTTMYGYNKEEQFKSNLGRMVDLAVEKIIHDYKNDIIDKSAEILANRLSRTKSAKVLKGE